MDQNSRRWTMKWHISISKLATTWAVGARAASGSTADWFDQRNECGMSTDCIRILYRGRIRAFHDVLEWWYMLLCCNDRTMECTEMKRLLTAAGRAGERIGWVFLS